MYLINVGRVSDSVAYMDIGKGCELAYMDIGGRATHGAVAEGVEA